MVGGDIQMVVVLLVMVLSLFALLVVVADVSIILQ